MRKILVACIISLFLSGSVASDQKPKYDNDTLQKLFDAYNDTYFDGNLPPTRVTWVDIPKEGDAYIMGNTHEELVGKTYSIEIDTKSNLGMLTTELTIFHELCHLKTMDYAFNHGEGSHGKTWQSCMHQLASEGAFDTIW